MNWLVICSERGNLSEMAKIVESNFADSSVSASLIDSLDFNQMGESLSAATNCIVVADCVSKTGCLEFACGFLCGRGVPVYVVETEASTMPSSVPELQRFPGISALSDFLLQNKKQIAADSVRRAAFAQLFENGHPFDADSFAQCIVSAKRELCALYLDAGMDVNSRDKDGTPMLNVAVRADNLEFVRWLLDCGADINAVSSDRGYTALMDAVWRGNKEIAEFLAERGADVNVVNKEGQTMIVLAVGMDKIELSCDLCRLLAEHGADPDIPDSMGMSAYGYAKLFGKDAVVSILEKYHKE